MNNAARGVILALGLMGAAFMFIGMLDYATQDDFKLEDLGGVLACGLPMLSCAVIAAAALVGMTPSPPKPVSFPYQQQGQPYPQPGTGPQQAVPQQAVPQQYAPQQYGTQPQQPQQPRQD